MHRAFRLGLGVRVFLLLFCVGKIEVGGVWAQPKSFSQRIGKGDDIVEVDFKLFPIRSPNFGVLVQQADGSFKATDVPAERTYLGSVKGQPGAMASGLIRADGTLLCRISFENGAEWSSTNSSFSKWTPQWTPQWPTTTVPPSSSNSVLVVAEVGVDSSYSHYVASGSSILGTLDMVEFSIMATNIPFMRDASIVHKIGKVVIRANQSRDPYPSSDTTVLIKMVRRQWNTDIATIVGKTHNLALVVNYGAGGGLAWVGTVGASNAYSANGGDSSGDFSITWRHEVGHNWGSRHYEGGGHPEGPTIMSDNQLSRFSSSELAKILQYKSKLSLPNISYPRPPRANMDVAETQGADSVIVNVLANDLDANVKGLQLISIQNIAPINSSIQISNNQVLYTPSFAAMLSVDYFSYRIQNNQNATSTGYVIIRPNSLIGWWKMRGLTAEDWSGRGASGSISGSTSWDVGNGALTFGGVGMVSFGIKPSLNGTTSFTISAWVRVPATATIRGVIIQQRSPSSNKTNGYVGEYQLSIRGGRLKFFVYGNYEYQFSLSADVALNDYKWHHVSLLFSI